MNRLLDHQTIYPRSNKTLPQGSAAPRQLPPVRTRRTLVRAVLSGLAGTALSAGLVLVLSGLPAASRHASPPDAAPLPQTRGAGLMATPGQILALLPTLPATRTLAPALPPAQAVPASSRTGATATVLAIQATSETDSQGITGLFSPKVPAGLDIASWEWDLGNGQKSFQQEARWTYRQPGTYAINLKARGGNGTLYRSDPYYLDVPYPATLPQDRPRFITLSSLRDTLELPGELLSVNGNTDPVAMPLVLAGETNGRRQYQALKTGYFHIKTLVDGREEDTWLYVSPIPSLQVENPNLNWYRTQFNTGTLSNCGPSSVSMAIAWAKSSYTSVYSIRQTVGWRGDGGTSFDELRSALDSNGVRQELQTIKSAQDLCDILDAGSIAIVLIHTSKITRSVDLPSRDPYGRYYTDSVGHYIVVKGYSLDGKYFVVHDPVPADWGSNSFRQPDGISMMGRNRYYASTDILRGLRSNQVIRIYR